MKKTLTLLLSIILLFTSILPVHAETPSAKTTRIVSLENGYKAEITIEVYETPGTARSATNYKSSTLTYQLKKDSGKIVATFKLNGTFSYNGVTSSCTSSACSKSILDDNWQFTEAYASRSGNKAIGKFTAIEITWGATSQTISDTVTLTCDKNGNIY